MQVFKASQCDFGFSRSGMEYMNCKFIKWECIFILMVKVRDISCHKQYKLNILGTLQNKGEMERYVNHYIQRKWIKWRSVCRAGSWGVQGVQWSRASPRYGPQKKNQAYQNWVFLFLVLSECFFGGWFEVSHEYDSDFYLWMYRIYTAPCIYL